MKGHEYYSSGFTIAQIQDELTEKIKIHKWIDSVESIEIEKGFTGLNITITLEIGGESIESEVQYIV